MGLPYTATCSFDTAGRTMMGLLPDALPAVFEGLVEAPLAMGANCGVGASDILVSLLEMTASPSALAFITKGNCGVPEFCGMDIHYSGTPEIMAAYAELAVNAGARIVGGCCGTSPVHLAAMRAAVDAAVARNLAGDVATRPTIESIVGRIGPMANAAPSPNVARADGGSPRRRRRPTH